MSPQSAAAAGGHGLSVERLVAHEGHGAGGGGKLVGADHLVAGDEAGDGAVGDGDEERLVGDRGEVEEAEEGVGRLHLREVERGAIGLDALDVAHHARGLAEEHLDVHVDGRIVEMLVLEDEAAVAGGLADECNGAALARAELLEEYAGVALQGKHIALLRLAAPDLHRVHGDLLVGHLAELEAPAGGLDELGASVGESARADVVDRVDWVLRAERGAGVDHALAAALHLCVAALHAVEVERLVVRAGHHRGRRSAAEADAHRRPAYLHDVRARGHGPLLDLVAHDHAVAAGEHYGLVVAAVLAAHLGLVRAEEPGELRAAELVAERRPAEGPLRHDR